MAWQPPGRGARSGRQGTVPPVAKYAVTPPAPIGMRAIRPQHMPSTPPHPGELRAGSPACSRSPWTTVRQRASGCFFQDTPSCCNASWGPGEHRGETRNKEKNWAHRRPLATDAPRTNGRRECLASHRLHPVVTFPLPCSSLFRLRPFCMPFAALEE